GGRRRVEIAGSELERALRQKDAHALAVALGARRLRQDLARAVDVALLQRAARRDVAIFGGIGLGARLAALELHQRARLAHLALGARVLGRVALLLALGALEHRPRRSIVIFALIGGEARVGERDHREVAAQVLDTQR